jgi:DNA-directed RNA polymerase sigma subunit (sigma70/sigma32)
VRLGTSRVQRTLFFSRGRTQRALDARRGGAGAPGGLGVAGLAAALAVKPAEAEELARRIVDRDISLDAPVGDGGSATRLDLLPGEGPTH